MMSRTGVDFENVCALNIYLYIWFNNLSPIFSCGAVDDNDSDDDVAFVTDTGKISLHYFSYLSKGHFS